MVEEQETIIVVVCPDGVVGAIVHGAMGLERYFEGVFGKTGGTLAMDDHFPIKPHIGPSI